MRRSFALLVVSLAAIGWCVSRFHRGDAAQELQISETAGRARRGADDATLALKGITSGDLRTQLSQRGLECDGPHRESSRIRWVCANTNYRVEFVGESPTRIEYVTGTAIQAERAA